MRQKLGKVNLKIIQNIQLSCSSPLEYLHFLKEKKNVSPGNAVFSFSVDFHLADWKELCSLDAFGRMFFDPRLEPQEVPLLSAEL